TQIKALQAQEVVRTELRNQRNTVGSEQAEMFALHDMSRDETAEFLQREKRAALEALLSAAPLPPASERFGTVATNVMLNNVVRRVELGRIAAQLRKDGLIQISPWPARKVVPDDDYRISRSPTPAPHSN